jgi:hypothetical protein
VGDGLGEGVNVGVLVTVGLAVGMGEAVAVAVNAGAAWDRQAVRRTIIRLNITIRFMRKGVVKELFQRFDQFRQQVR